MLAKKVGDLKIKFNVMRDQIKKVNYLNGLFCLHNGDFIRALARRVDALTIEALNKLQDFHLTENGK